MLLEVTAKPNEKPPHGPRVFSVRSFDAAGSVDTVGEFARAKTQAEAMANLRDHLATKSLAA